MLVSTMGTRIVSARDGGSPRPVPALAQSVAALGDLLLTTDTLQRVSAFQLATGVPASLPGIERLKGSRIAVSADGSTIALATASASSALARAGMMGVRIHDARSLRLLRVLESHLAAVEGLAVRPDGAELTVASRGGAIARWNLLRGELEGSSKSALGIGRSSVSYDDSSALIAVSSGGRLVTVHDARTGRVLRQSRSRDSRCWATGASPTRFRHRGAARRTA